MPAHADRYLAGTGQPPTRAEPPDAAVRQPDPTDASAGRPALARPDRRPATDAEARALASATRLRILRLCLDRPLTNKEIAVRLALHPATTLHHVRTLVANGFLAPQQERRGRRNAREVPYLATGKSWTLRTGGSGVTGAGVAMIDAFLAEARLADPDEVPFARLGLRLSPIDLAELRERLSELLDEFATRPRDPSAPPYSLFIALHPDTSRD